MCRGTARRGRTSRRGTQSTERRAWRNRLGKGAWDCDRNEAIPPEMESTVFEEQPTSELNYEGIPTVPTRKNLTHMSFFCNGCRYRCGPARPARRRGAGGP